MPYVYLTFSLPLLSGANPGDAFGTGLASGDLDGDGRMELVVSAPGDDTAGTDAGAIFVFEGDGFSLSPTPTQAIYGAAGDGLGAALALGDLDGDGFLDLIVGAPTSGTGGEALVFAGSASGLASSPAVTIAGAAAGDDFGTSIATGDFNGDGTTDLLVGAPGADGGGTDRGAAYVFDGGVGGVEAAASWSSGGAADGDWLGMAVDSAGDTDGNGVDDVLVGAPGVVAGAWAQGEAYVFLATGAGPAAVATWTNPAAVESTILGSRLSHGDFDGDGYGDVVVGGAWDDVGARRWPGSAAGPTLVSTSGDLQRGSYCSAYLGPAADVDDDGSDDLLYADIYDNGGSSSSSDWTYQTGVAVSMSTSALAGLELPESFAHLGDLDGNGLGDAAFGDPTDAGWVSIRLLATDEDGDGAYADFGGLVADCDDADDTVLLGAEEVDGDGVDQDCDGADDRVYTHVTVCPVFLTPADGFPYVDDPFHGVFDPGAVFDEVASAAAALPCDSTAYGSSAWVACGEGDGAVGNLLAASNVHFLDIALAVATLDGAVAVMGSYERTVDYDWSRSQLGAAVGWEDGTGSAVVVATEYIHWYDDGWTAIDLTKTEVEWEIDGCSLRGVTSDDALSEERWWEIMTPAQRLVVYDGWKCDTNPPDGQYVADLDGVWSTVDAKTWAVIPDVDADADGWPSNLDCDDADPARYPCAPEAAGDGIDANCDGDADEPDTDQDGVDDWEDCAPTDPVLPELAYFDEDGDGFGGEAYGVACVLEAGLTLQPDDCDDANAAIYPGASETCDAVDNDCDGKIDEGFSAKTTWVDADGDRFGSAEDPGTESCAPAPGSAGNNGDCDDTNAAVNPDEAEIPGDGIDQDCDGKDEAAPPSATGPEGCERGCSTVPPASGAATVVLSLVVARRRGGRQLPG